MDHTIRVEAEMEEITAFGDNRRRQIATGYNATCRCGWTSHEYDVDGANVAASQHLDWAQGGTVSVPPCPPAPTPVNVRRVVLYELEQQKERMLETGDIFAGLD